MGSSEGGAPDAVLGVIDRAGICLSEMPNVAVAHAREYPARGGAFLNPVGLPLEPRVRQFLARSPSLGRGLFRHQFEGVRQVLDGRHVVISTPTSSGKSLVFGLPVLDALARDRSASALLLYPQKALANDQLRKLRDMVVDVLGPTPPALVSRYDGATPQDRRPEIRRDGRVILTNPDMLHLAMLQYHDKWGDFFRNLRYVVVDEAHDYRGIFGSSVAYILRRLRAVAKRYGASPVFISASATIDQPTEHLRRLTGLEFTEVGAPLDGSVQGRKKLWLLRTGDHHYKVGRDLTIGLVERGLSCLTFCPSRTAAERLLDDLPESVRKDDRIRVYRAGLRSQEREEIERGLADGTVRAVFSTSALELGIDIGALDAVVCVGVPNTMMSLWQRAGRVGRAGKEGAIFFIPADTPLDTYYVEHPQALFDREGEPLAVNLQNRRLVCHHLACAMDEAGDERLLDFSCLGPEAEHAAELRQHNRLNHEIFYATEKHGQTPIRSSDARNYQLILQGEPIGEIDQWHLLREAYPRAIYLHGGRRFRVQDIFRSLGEVRLIPEYTRNRTIPVIRKAVKTRRVRAVHEYPGLVVTEADLEVTERLIAVQEKKPDGKLFDQYEGSQGLPPHRLPTEGIAIEVKGALLAELDGLVYGVSPMGVYRAIERLIGGLFPVIAGPCDTMDFDTFSERREGSVLLYLYDQVHDGIDLTVQAFDRVAELLESAHQRVVSCDCEVEDGCFRCVRNPDAAEAADKASTARALARLVRVFEENAPKSRNFNVDLLEEQPEAAGQCPKCQSRVKADDRFCSNCGEPQSGA